VARYRLQLHDGPATPAIGETIDAGGDEDAMDLARITLLVTPAYTHAEIYRGHTLIGTCERDSYAMRQRSA
jgi:hypothetical protein